MFFTKVVAGQRNIEEMYEKNVKFCLVYWYFRSLFDKINVTDRGILMKYDRDRDQCVQQRSKSV